MQYGHFDDLAREYVITRPDTPSPWINYLGSETFFTLMSNTSGGYSFYKDARMLRITRYRYNNVPTDAGGQYFYINDGGSLWTPGWMPVKAKLDSYECRHGLGYTRITGAKDGLKAEQLSFVPRGVDALVTRVKLTNESAAKKDVSLYSFVEFCLWNAQDDSTNFQRNFSTGEVEIEGSAIYHKTEYRERRNHFAVYAVNAEIDGFDTDRATFIGYYNGFGEPQVPTENKSQNSVASGFSPIGSHCLKREIAPGETVSFIFVLGYCENPDDQKFIAPNVINKAPAYKLLDAFKTDAQFEAAFGELNAYWAELLSSFQVNSGDERVDRMAGLWNQYQCMVTFNMSRSASYYESGIGRGMGFRDSTQDLLGFVHLIPARARERILDIAATQFPDGSAYHQYQPLTKRGNNDIGSGFNDDPLWLIFGVAAYVKETGDLSILSEMVPFDNDEKLAQPLMEHLRRSIHYTLEHLGPHGLPLIGRADWNDCLNLNCFSTTPGESFQTTENNESGAAESTFIGGMFTGDGIRIWHNEWKKGSLPSDPKVQVRYGFDNGYTCAGAFFPYPGSKDSGIWAPRDPSTPSVYARAKAKDAAAGIPDLWTAEGNQLANTVCTPIESGYYKGVAAYQFFDFGGKRYIAYAKQVSDRDGRVIVMQGDTTDSWEDIMTEHNVIYQASMQDDVEFFDGDYHPEMEIESIGLSNNLGMDLSIRVMSDCVYIACVKQGIGLSLFKLSAN